MPDILTVRLLDAPFRADRDYDYLPPENFADPLSSLKGRIVQVPFGSSDRGAYAVVTRTRTGVPERPLKRVVSLLPADFRLTEDILALCFFLREHTLCSVGEAVRAALPAAAFGLIEERYYPTPGAPVPGGKAGEVLSFLSANPGQSRMSLEKIYGKQTGRSLSLLTKTGAVEKRTERTGDCRVRVEKHYAVAETPATDKDFRTDGQRAVYAFLRDQGECSREEIAGRLNIAVDSPLHSLVGKGLLRVCEREIDRNPYAALAKKRDLSPVALSRAQGEAFDALSALYDTHRAACALLFGVTGSGKTKVMMKLLDRVLAEGRQAILLVPEISLTPQTVGIFCSRYGERVSVLHSSLSAGERFDAYRKIASGGADLVIGTRSAIFAPLPRLSLILIDEEHEHTYKSDANPRYHTRDVAAFRSGQTGALTVLASATPSVEDYYKAQTGKYTLVPLTERFGGALLPTTEIVDMREELRAGNTSPLSRALTDGLRETKEGGRQAILFLNRRGYHHAVLCKSCGEALMCPHCSVGLTYHTNYTGSYLLCHACGMKQPLPTECPSCGAKPLSFVGAGTQKAEAEISSLLPGTRVVRMDADTTGTKSAYDRLLGKFRAGEADVLLGTQMVTKGHDFPKVSLSGVLLADTSLYMNDFRAAERTFSLLTQVIGRAGRAADPGRAIIQTFSPEHEVIRLAAAQDYPAFYEREIALRRALRYPPFCDIAEWLLSSENEGELLRAAASARDGLIASFRDKAPELPCELYGPLELQNYRVAEKYRLKLLIKCRLSPRVRALFADFLLTFTAANPKISVSVDFNPTDT